MMQWFGRIVVALALLLVSLALIAVSMVANYSFWTADAALLGSFAWIQGLASIAIDALKSLLPPVIAWSRISRARFGLPLAILLLTGCMAFSMAGAIGFATTVRSTSTAERRIETERSARLQAESRDMQDRLTALPPSRPTSVIDQEIARARLDRRWVSSKGCAEATVEVSRAYCRDIATLAGERAASEERTRLSRRADELSAEVEGLMHGSARHGTDLQAERIAGLLGVAFDGVQTSLIVLFAVLIEAGAAFGLYLAALPLRMTAETAAVAGPDGGRSQRLSSVLRIVRLPNGHLMLEAGRQAS